MHPSLRLGGGDALHAVHARLVFQCAIDLFARHAEDDFLEAARGAFRVAGHGHFPALHLAELGVHAEEVPGKEGRFVAARSAADFHDDVLVVLRVGRNEQQLDLFFYFGDALFGGGQFLAGHVFHVRVVLRGQHLLGVLHGLQAVQIILPGLHDVAQVLILLGEFHVAFLVADHVRVGDERAHFLVAAHQTFQFVQNSVAFCHNIKFLTAKIHRKNERALHDGLQKFVSCPSKSAAARWGEIGAGGCRVRGLLAVCPFCCTPRAGVQRGRTAQTADAAWRGPGLRRAGLRRVPACFAESIRVLAAEYSSTLRKVQSAPAQGVSPPSASGRPEMRLRFHRCGERQ